MLSSPPTATGGREARAADRGSALMLMPAGVLIVLLLGAITFDLTHVRVAQRELIAAAGDAANDAVTYGLDESRLRRGEGYRLDDRRAREAVAATLAATGLLQDLAEAPEVVVGTDGTVEVHLVRRVPHVFGRALPGVDEAVVHGRAAARIEVS